MASAPQANLPLFYNDLTPLNSRDHGDWRSRGTDRAKWVAQQHAIPLTVEEFPLAQRDYPIVFSNSETPVPLALMGLNEGVNTFFDEEGKQTREAYIPAYIRRYPFLLAKLQPNTDQMSLCVDPSSGLVGEFDDGDKLFDGDQASEHTNRLLQFCQNFEEAGMRTQQFVEELTKHDLLMDGEVSIANAAGGQNAQPFVYRGFKMVNQEKMRDLTGDQLRKWNQNGLLPLIFAHLFSLDQMRTIFARQVEQGKGPVQNAAGGAAMSADATQDT